jgi:hypothetical protein
MDPFVTAIVVSAIHLIPHKDLSGRTVRVSVAEPGQSLQLILRNVAEDPQAKERPALSAGADDDSKYDSPWRRDGPIPDSTEGSRRRHDSSNVDRSQPAMSDIASEWRSSRVRSAVPEPEAPPRRRGSGFSTFDSQGGIADKEEVWSIGGKFKPTTAPSAEASKLGSLRGRGDVIPAKDSPSLDEGDWRSTRSRSVTARNNTSRAHQSACNPHSFSCDVYSKQFDTTYPAVNAA